MRNRILLSLLFGAALLFTACKRNSVQLTYSNASGEVPRQGNLVFHFNRALVPDSMVNNWDSTEYVDFDPKIAGRFRWEAPDKLVFSPEHDLAPATDYSAKLTREVLRWSKYNDIRKAGNIHFSTALLQLSDAQATWVLPNEGAGSALPQITLDFNYPVRADDLRDKLKIKVDGKEVAWQPVTASAANSLQLRLPGFRSEDRDYEAEIGIDRGLVPVGGQRGTADPLKAQLNISSPYVLNINNVESEHDGSEGVVRIYTSQQLQEQALTSYIRFQPAIKYTAEYTEYGVLLRSEQFSPENSYALTVARGLRGRIGGVLKEESSNQVLFGALEPEIRFSNSKAMYLSKKGSGNLEVRISNMQQVRLVISKIYENNILNVRRHGYSPRERDVDGNAQNASYSEDGGDGEEGYEESSAMGGDVIYTQVIDTRSLPRSGHGRLLNLAQFRDRLPEFRGIYHVEIRSTSQYWENDSRLISFSDIGLIARQGGDKMYVFANSIKTALPQTGVTVSAYGSNNQLLGTATTNGNGVAELRLTRRDFTGFRPALLIARTADDMNYLPFNGTRVGTSRFDVGGKRLSAVGMDAFIYAERDIYRPGEFVNFALLLRDRAWRSPGELPVKYKFLFPNGKEAASGVKTLNEGGMAEGTIRLPLATITGSYTLELYSSNDVLLATKTFNVEEFVPDRIKVTAKLDKSAYTPGEQAALAINAVNFFGPPAANRNYELEVQVRGKTFAPAGFESYDFSLSEAGSIRDKEVKEGRTDAAGNASERYAIPALYNEHGLLQASFFATVFDETGRPVARKATADIFTQSSFFGLADDGYYYYTLNQPASFQLASVGKDGKAISATAHVRVIKHEYNTVLTKSGNYFRYESQEQDKILYDGNLAVHGHGGFSFVPRTPGSYELRIYRPGSDAYVSKKFYSYGPWGGDNSSFEVDNEGQVAIDLDKDAYKVGETARVLFKAPFSGRMLVTVERDGVQSYCYLDVAKRSASMDLKLDGAHVPNIYITATLFKAHEVSDIPLTVAHGYKNVSVEEPGRHMQVAIEAPKTSRSNRRQTVRVKAAPNSFVTLAAVDNGVLQITDFATPDPYGFFYQKRALEVQGYDLYPLLFPELRARLSSTGGDGGTDMDKRVNPMQAKRVKILSYWSGIRKTDGSGYASFSFDVPQFSGSVRLMALTAKDDRFGSAEASIQVADPVVLSTALPRFLSPGDTAYVPLTISNTTSRSSTGTATMQVSGPLQVAGASSQQVVLGPNSEARVLFKVVAGTLGVGKLTSKVQALGEGFTETIDISVRPASTLQQRSGSGSVAGGSTQRIAIPDADFLPGSSNYQLLVSRSPVVELADQLRWLVQYPYGCTEQTVSSAFPQLYYGDLATLVNDRSDRRNNANANVLEAIRRIKMRQLYNGAVTLWDGEHEEDWWATVYAAHFLVEAKKAGFEVDNSLLETMFGYLQTKLKNRNYITYYYNRNQSRRIAPKEVPYSLYVLALAGRPNVPVMNFYKANPDYLALDGKYLLSASYAVAGDRRSFAAFLPASFSGEASVAQTGGSFYSEARDEALALNALLEADPGNAQVPVMARHVADRLKTQRYLNTQERVFSFLALGKLARGTAASNVTAEIRVGGRSVARVSDASWKGTRAQLGSGAIELVTQGNGRLYYSWVAEGISRSGSFVQEDSYVRIRRSYFDRFGNQLTGTSFRQNDLIVVALTVEKAYSNAIENLVLTDLLPAGFEIENPRTSEVPGLDWIKDNRQPDALDVRDDRIHFFINLHGDRQTYYYAVRAVSPGVYRQGPASADAMYRGEIHSYHGAGSIRVVPQ